jgi:hypothetical protein
VRADRVTIKGSLFIGNAAVPFVNRMTVQLPGQFKSVIEMGSAGKTRTVVHILDGAQASITVDGQPMPAEGPHLAQLRRTLELDTAMRLVPLLDTRRFTLRSLGDYELFGRAVRGVAVQGSGQRGLKLYFDKETAHLMAAEHELEGGVVQQARYSDYRDMGGYLRPGKVVVLRGGKKVMEAELAEAKRVERIDPAEFRIP